MLIKKFDQMNENLFDFIKNIKNNWETVALATISTNCVSSTILTNTIVGKVKGQLYIQVERKKTKN